MLAAHAVPLLAAEWRGTDAPVAVWLVPSDTIRTQTLKALQTSGHPTARRWRRCMAWACACARWTMWPRCPRRSGGRPVVIVVATIQSFRIDDAGQRNVQQLYRGV